jgi:hypothetical protein
MDGGGRFILCSEKRDVLRHATGNSFVGGAVLHWALCLKVRYNLGAWGEENHTYLSELVHNNNSWAP